MIEALLVEFVLRQSHGGIALRVLLRSSIEAVQKRIGAAVPQNIQAIDRRRCGGDPHSSDGMIDTFQHINAVGHVSEIGLSLVGVQQRRSFAFAAEGRQ